MKSGIYKITCRMTQKVYVGCAVDIARRWADHRAHLRRGSHNNRHFQSAWAKYGEESFSFDVIEVADPKLLITLEAEHIARLSACDRRFGYNTLHVGRTRLGVPHTAKTKALMSLRKMGNKSRCGKPHTDETKARMSLSQKGKVISAEQRAKLSVAQTGKHHSAETRKRLSDVHIGVRKPAGFGRRIAEARAFFSQAEVPIIRALHQGGTSQRKIAQMFGTSHVVVGKVVRGLGPFYSTV